VTNEHRTFVHTAQISELATEMKAYAKTFSGSIYVVDRRTDHPQSLEEAASAASPGHASPHPEVSAPREDAPFAAAAVAREAGGA
jgi:hypothetical protein